MDLKYKKGDEVLLRGRVVDIDGSYGCEYNIDFYVGHQTWIDDYAFTEDAIVGLYNPESKSEKQRKHCECYTEENGKQICNGTKERDECNCNGDEFNCSFYDDVKERAKKSGKFTVAECTSSGTVVTADVYHAVLKDLRSFEYWEFLAMMHWSDYEAPMDKDGCILRLIEKHKPVEVVDKYELFMDKRTIKVGDVITLGDNTAQYLVIKVIDDTYHMISENFTTICLKSKGNMGLTEPFKFKKIKSNVWLKEFFNLD